MLTTQEFETVLVSPESQPTGHERIVVGFRSGDDLFVPLDRDRPANAELARHSRLYVRRSDSARAYTVYDVVGRNEISPADRQRLEAHVHKPISTTTEVLHLVGSQQSVEQDLVEAPRLVAVIDGGERTLRALTPAANLAKWYGRRLDVVAVVDETDEMALHPDRSAVRSGLEQSGILETEVTWIASSDLDVCLIDLMRKGHVVISAAFGVWAGDGRLHGMLTGLVKHNAPAVVGIGPNVAIDWEATADRPTLICVDSTDHAHDFVGRIGPWIAPTRSKIMVVHITTEVPPDRSVALNVASELHHCYDLPVEAKHVNGTNVAETIGSIAATVNAQLIVVNSWHRPPRGERPVASTSVRSVAHAACPVVILSAQ